VWVLLTTNGMHIDFANTVDKFKLLADIYLYNDNQLVGTTYDDSLNVSVRFVS